MKPIVMENDKGKNNSLQKVCDKYGAEKIRTKDVGEVQGFLDYSLRNNFDLVISAGGDGTLNGLINKVMDLGEDERNRLSISALPCGKANDFARNYGLSGNLEKSMNKILNGTKNKLDLMKVNESYFITGGGFGFPSEVVEERNVSKLGFMKDLLYLYIVSKKLLKGYEGIDEVSINDEKKKDLMLVSIMNQPFIGKRFYLSPRFDKKESSLEACLIKKRSTLKDISAVDNITKGKHLDKNFTEIIKSDSFNIKFNSPKYFMGDGELLDFSKEFNISKIPNALNFVY